MSYFVVKYCELKACQHWRLDNQCVKDGEPIDSSIQHIANMHDSSVCQIREQMDIYRLQNLLEDSNGKTN